MRSTPRRWLATLAMLAGCCVAVAAAQSPLALPATPPLPDPLPQLLPGTRDAANGLVERSLRSVAGLREREIRQLLRRHRDVIDTDPSGAPVVRGELVAIDPVAGLLPRLQAAGFGVRGESVLDGLPLRVVLLRAPTGLSARAALALAERVDPAGSYDYNHLYWRAASPSPRAVLQQASAASGRHAFRVGLVDSGPDPAHPALAGTEIHAWGCDGRPVADAHGTAVASLLAGRAVADARDSGTLYAADVYCGRPTGGAAAEVARALAWMARERVAVINVSLVGPPNKLLQRTIAAMTAQGHLIVAAVGNDGPAAPPLYPAAYDGVVGVAAVNARRRVLPESARGPQVDFAAPGADMVAAAPGGRWSMVRGTSYAAPLVARLAAQAMDAPGAGRIPEVLAQLARQAVPVDGPREAYGRGILASELRIARAPAP